MKTTFKYALLATVAGVFTTASAFATEPGPYVGIGMGLHMPQDSNARVQVPAGAASTNFNTTFDNGFIGVGTFGYKWEKNFRTELEVGYRQADVHTVRGTSALGVQKDLGFSANLLYDFDTQSAFTPYIGVGLGVSSNKWRNVVTTGSPAFTDRTTGLQWQGIVGGSLRVSNRVEVFADYRYIGAGSNRFDSVPRGSIVTDHKDRSHNVLIGLRFALGTPKSVQTAQASPPPPPPPAPRAMPAPPAPPPVTQKFLVFFDFDKAVLRTDAQKIVSEAAAYARTNGKAVIAATGHTDSAGTADYNMKLSEHRAASVKAALEKLGFSAKDVVVRWKGEAEPLVAMGDGVKEPQNWRVEIVFE